MPEVLTGIMKGFSIATLPMNLLLALVGCFCGTLVGALPGIGPSATIAILLPVTFGMEPTSAIIMLAGIYYGATYGGSITSILMNIPGDPSSVMSTLDGYQLAMQGRAGVALGMAAISSFIAGTFSVVALMLIAPPVADFAVRFGPPEYFALIFLGLTLIVYLGGKSVIKGLISGVAGLVIGTVGVDPMQGFGRYDFGIVRLADGVPFIVVAMGLFAVAEVLVNIEKPFKTEFITNKISGFLPTIKDWIACRGAFVRGTLIGFFVGVLPGAGATIASFLAYGIEKRVSKNPERFGAGAIEGVAAPEGANNAATGGAMVPLFALGIPGSSSTAILLGGMMMYGLRPGPLLISQNPDFFWGVVASMYIGNMMLLVMNLPLAGVFARLTRLPYSVLYPLILLFVVIGAYSLNNSVFEVWLVLIFGVVGYIMRKLDFPLAPLVLALVLGPMAEKALSQSLTMSHGSLAIFFTRPIAAVIFAFTLVMMVSPLLKKIWGRRQAG